MNSSKIRPTIVLVHGAFADATSWGKVILLLEEEKFRVTAVQLSLRSLADDVATTRRVIESQPEDTILAGHSYEITIRNRNLRKHIYDDKK